MGIRVDKTVKSQSLDRVTREDVAQLAGVSGGTVSLALRDDAYKFKLNPQTVERIRAVAHKLNYRPHPFARRLAQGSNYHSTVVVMSPISSGFGGEHNHRVIAGIVEAAAGKSVDVKLRHTVFDQNDPTVSSIGSSDMMDGIILHTWQGIEQNEKIITELISLDVPFVLANHYIDDPRVPCVGGDLYAVGKSVAAYLALLGHKKIAVLLPPAHVPKGRIYLDGIRAGFGECGIEIPDDQVMFNSTYEQLDETEFMHCFHRRRKFTAFITCSDLLAFQMSNKFRGEGIKVPEDVSLIGFSPSEFSKLLWPNLTTVIEHGKLIGEKTMELLDDLMKGREVNRKIKISFELAPGQTCRAI